MDKSACAVDRSRPSQDDHCLRAVAVESTDLVNRRVPRFWHDLTSVKAAPWLTAEHSARVNLAYCTPMVPAWCSDACLRSRCMLRGFDCSLFQLQQKGALSAPTPHMGARRSMQLHDTPLLFTWCLTLAEVTRWHRTSCSSLHVTVPLTPHTHLAASAAARIMHGALPVALEDGGPAVTWKCVTYCTCDPAQLLASVPG